MTELLREREKKIEIARRASEKAIGEVKAGTVWGGPLPMDSSPEKEKKKGKSFVSERTNFL